MRGRKTEFKKSSRHRLVMYSYKFWLWIMIKIAMARRAIYDPCIVQLPRIPEETMSWRQ